MGCPATVKLNNGYETIWAKAQPIYLALTQLEDRGDSGRQTRDYLIQVAQGQEAVKMAAVSICLNEIGLDEAESSKEGQEILYNVVLSSFDGEGNITRFYGRSNWHIKQCFRPRL